MKKPNFPQSTLPAPELISKRENFKFYQTSFEKSVQELNAEIEWLKKQNRFLQEKLGGLNEHSHHT